MSTSLCISLMEKDSRITTAAGICSKCILNFSRSVTILLFLVRAFAISTQLHHWDARYFTHSCPIHKTAARKRVATSRKKHHGRNCSGKATSSTGKRVPSRVFRNWWVPTAAAKYKNVSDSCFVQEIDFWLGLMLFVTAPSFSIATPKSWREEPF